MLLLKSLYHNKAFSEISIRNETNTGKKNSLELYLLLLFELSYIIISSFHNYRPKMKIFVSILKM